MCLAPTRKKAATKASGEGGKKGPPSRSEEQIGSDFPIYFPERRVKNVVLILMLEEDNDSSMAGGGEGTPPVLEEKI